MLDIQENNEVVDQSQPVKEQKSSHIKIICVIGMLVGLLIILLGITSGGTIASQRHFDSDNVREVRFGADFYTEIHNATATAANNIGELILLVDSSTEQLVESFGLIASALRLIPISIGLLMFFSFLLQFVKIKT